MRKNIHINKAGEIATIVVAFLLSLLDITLLTDAIMRVLSLSSAFAALLAMLASLVGSTIAFFWGRSNGKSQTNNLSVNGSFKNYLFIIWFIIGILLIALRITDIASGSNVNLAGNIWMAAFLAVLYAATGLKIADSSRKLFDADMATRDNNAKNLAQLRRKLDNTRQDVAERCAEIEGLIERLSEYDKHYKSLDSQYEKYKWTIEKAEEGVMSEIVAKTVKQGKVTADTAEDVKNAVLKKDREEHEVFHDKARQNLA